jgi:putative heme-binding domain-containing protein
VRNATALALWTAWAVWGQTANPVGGDPAAVEVGRGIFRIYCSPCHGIQGEGGKGPSLLQGTLHSGGSDAELYQAIAAGIPGTEMPGFGGALTADGVWRVVAFLRSVNQPGTPFVPGDRAAGERLFWNKGGCGRCHRVGARGGRFGPELSRIGRARTLQHLRESLEDPGRDIASGYATVSVVTRDGRRIVGVERGRDNFSVRLLDAREQYHSFLKEDVQSIQPESRSLMPSYRGVLTSGELDDLLAYLASLTAAGAAR